MKRVITAITLVLATSTAAAFWGDGYNNGTGDMTGNMSFGFSMNGNANVSSDSYWRGRDSFGYYGAPRPFGNPYYAMPMNEGWSPYGNYLPAPAAPAE